MYDNSTPPPWCSLHWCVLSISDWKVFHWFAMPSSNSSSCLCRVGLFYMYCCLICVEVIVKRKHWCYNFVNSWKVFKSSNRPVFLPIWYRCICVFIPLSTTSYQLSCSHFLSSWCFMKIPFLENGSIGWWIGLVLAFLSGREIPAVVAIGAWCRNVWTCLCFAICKSCRFCTLHFLQLLAQGRQ